MTKQRTKQFQVVEALVRGILLGAIFLAATTAMGETPSAAPGGASLTAKSAEAKVAKGIVYSGVIDIDTSSGINSTEPTDYSGTYRITGRAKKVSQNLSASAVLGYTQNYSHELDLPEYGTGRTGDFEDMIIGLRKTFPQTNLGVIDSTWIGLSSVAPISTLSAKRGLRGQLGPTAGYSLKWKRLSFSQIATYRYAFYKNDIRDNGTVNSPHQMSLASSAAYSLTDKLSASLEIILRRNVSFQQVVRNQTITSASLDYEATERIAVSLGLSTLDSTLGEDGISERINYFDPDKTQASLTVSISL